MRRKQPTDQMLIVKKIRLTSVFFICQFGTVTNMLFLFYSMMVKGKPIVVPMPLEKHLSLNQLKALRTGTSLFGEEDAQLKLMG